MTRPIFDSIVAGFICVTLSSSVARLPAEDWTGWRGPKHDGISLETNWLTDWSIRQPKIVWTAEVGIGFSSFNVSDTRVVTAGHIDNTDSIVCLDLETGSEVWKHSYPASLDDRDFEGGTTSTPVIDDRFVYYLSRPGTVICLTLSDGALRWSKPVSEETGIRVPGWGFAGAPLIVGDRLILTMGESGVALDKHTGHVLWQSADKEAGYTSPVLASGKSSTQDQKLLVMASGRAFHGVDLVTGKLLWSERWLTSFGCNAADPIVRNGQVFLSSGYNRGAALLNLEHDPPEVVWKNKEMQNQLHGSVLFRDHLYGIDGDMEAGAKLRCMDWSTSEVRWTFDEVRCGGLAMAGSHLILLSDSGELIVGPVSPDAFQPTGRMSVLDGKCWVTPVLAHKRILCRSVSGSIACVDVR